MTEAELRYIEKEFERLTKNSKWGPSLRQSYFNHVLLGFLMSRTFDKLQEEIHEDWLDDIEQEKALARGEG